METTTESTTMKMGEARLTVPTATLFRAWMMSMLAEPAVSVIGISPQIPRIGDEWPEQGGRYVGVMRGAKGKPDYYLIVPTHPDASVLEIEWGGRGVDEPGANCEFDGLANTAALVQSGTNHPAAEWAAALVIDGRNDFYLPARREMRLAYVNAPELFEDGYHWSSTQHAAYSHDAWVQYFSDGSQSYGFKSVAVRARAFRRLIIQ